MSSSHSRPAGRWVPVLGGAALDVPRGQPLQAQVGAHDVAVYVLDAPVTDPNLRYALDRAMARATRRALP